MTSAYSLPTAAIPKHYHRSSEHLHHHSHGLSQSPPVQSSFSHSISTTDDGKRPLAASLGSSRRQSVGHRHSHTRDGNHSSSPRADSSRPNLPTIPSSADIPSTNGHWRTGSTAGGKPLITPTNASFDAAAMYQPPETQSHPHSHHDHGHDHGHDHTHGHHDHDNAGGRSKFTAMLLPYTSRYPLLHAIMTDKDSRRIFYFMSYVLLSAYIALARQPLEYRHKLT